MPVRAFRPDDAAAIAALFYAAVHEIAGRDYSERQVRAWAPDVPSVDRILRWAGDGRLFLVATDREDAPLAFCDLEADGHIDHLFCRPDVAGIGVASGLYDTLEAAARTQGLALLYVEASEPARRFFLRKDFAVTERRDFEIGGVPIHNYRMEKRL
ncbi:GNAT family N-acetyltransferase [Allosphingosinicella deserti]|uniref:GNAT family N-acetyltransferase n=1 Tax=Allosphingosinicella deserti TaxID=2116704 RepID=A0A2P7QSJ5_9SPHN|nr:GNAT family N-acetyltransferase [Sphingomonas deserti]PSJ40934.1 GNAT family N-acetyltransferase [Sphingomonas deserti]